MRLEVRRLLAVLALGFATSGCIATPFATPPIRAGIATGPRFVQGKGVDVPAVIHVGIHPFQMDRGLRDRRFDAGVGLIVERGAFNEGTGAYLEGSTAVTSTPIGSGWLKWWVGAQFRLLYNPESPLLGRGLVIRLALDFTTFESGPFSSHSRKGGAWGWAEGEAGVGGFLEFGYTQYGPANVAQGVIGIQFRIPATIGFAWGWIK